VSTNASRSPRARPFDNKSTLCFFSDVGDVKTVVIWEEGVTKIEASGILKDCAASGFSERKALLKFSVEGGEADWLVSRRLAAAMTNVPSAPSPFSIFREPELFLLKVRGDRTYELNLDWRITKFGERIAGRLCRCSERLRFKPNQRADQTGEARSFAKTGATNQRFRNSKPSYRLVL